MRPPSEVSALRDELLSRHEPPARAVYVYLGGCHGETAAEIAQAFAESLEAKPTGFALQDVRMLTVGCHGFCSVGPSACVVPPGVFYANLTPTDVARVVNQTLLRDEIVSELTLGLPRSKQRIPLMKDIPFFQLQTRRLTRNCGEVDPHRIEDSLMRGAYDTLAQVLEGGDPNAVLERVEASGLRGRGITTAPCAEKWKVFRRKGARTRRLTAYVRTWDPAAEADYLLLESDPHLFLEGMVLAALATGCEAGCVLVPPERPYAAQTLSTAVAQAYAYGLLGQGILGTSFSFEVAVQTSRLVRYPCSEDSPIGAATAELFHNVETLANLPRTVTAGKGSLQASGTSERLETVLVALGKGLQCQGVVEVGCGTPVAEVIEHLAGGFTDPEGVRGISLGGPLGRVLKPHELVAKPSGRVQQFAARPGTADVAAISAEECVVDVARRVAAFLVEESCGKCAPCRIGSIRMREMLLDFCRLDGRPEAMEAICDIANALQLAAGCEQGSRGAGCLLSLLEGFEETFLAHRPGGRCSAHVCGANVAA